MLEKEFEVGWQRGAHGKSCLSGHSAHIHSPTHRSHPASRHAPPSDLWSAGVRLTLSLVVRSSRHVLLRLIEVLDGISSGCPVRQGSTALDLWCLVFSLFSPPLSLRQISTLQQDRGTRPWSSRVPLASFRPRSDLSVPTQPPTWTVILLCRVFGLN